MSVIIHRLEISITIAIMYLSCFSFSHHRRSSAHFRQQLFPLSSHDLYSVAALLGVDQQVRVGVAPRRVLQNFFGVGHPDRFVVELKVGVG